VRKWWDGTPIEVNKPGDGIFFIGDFREVHWSAHACRALVNYARENHRWLIGTAILSLG